MNTDNAIPSLPDYEDKTLAPHKVGLVEGELDKKNIRQEFSWYVVINPDLGEIKVSKLVHVPSGFYFIFNCDEHDSMSYRMRPGLNVRTESAHPGSWEEVFRAFQRWLSILESNMHAGIPRIPGDLDEFSLLIKSVFNRDLPKHVSLAQEEGEPLSLVMLDIDKFKTAINDVHGHPVGDEVLRFIAGVIKRAVGIKGSCYRWGGDEIAILLPNHDVNEVTALAERIRKEIEAATISSRALKVTVSLGVAEFPSHAELILGSSWNLRLMAHCIMRSSFEILSE
jgi:diguanylate cyclase (GGDEF)-like protein